ncbi:hypothetical protein TcasGA2_TC008916 [Tribolium castaneum]|uniref:Uncharacterized protein n=1 Tax=Tribolium castaneum TaxID=7070 RepID=D6WQF3_TRICA|nr:hypothetical protein TcasGA2_TC008916 [Tribolium castaneum]
MVDTFTISPISSSPFLYALRPGPEGPLYRPFIATSKRNFYDPGPFRPNYRCTISDIKRKIAGNITISPYDEQADPIGNNNSINQAPNLGPVIAAVKNVPQKPHLFSKVIVIDGRPPQVGSFHNQRSVPGIYEMTVFRRFYNELDSHRLISIEPYHYGHKQSQFYRDSSSNIHGNISPFVYLCGGMGNNKPKQFIAKFEKTFDLYVISSLVFFPVRRSKMDYPSCGFPRQIVAN